MNFHLGYENNKRYLQYIWISVNLEFEYIFSKASKVAMWNMNLQDKSPQN